MKKTKKKYTGIAKVNDRGNIKCVKYRVNYPEQLLIFLQKNFNEVFWLNIYHNRGELYRERFQSWSKNKGWFNVSS